MHILVIFFLVLAIGLASYYLSNRLLLIAIGVSLLLQYLPCLFNPESAGEIIMWSPISLPIIFIVLNILLMIITAIWRAKHKGRNYDE